MVFNATNTVPLGENGTFLCVTPATMSVPAWRIMFSNSTVIVIPSLVTTNRTYVYDNARGIVFTYDEGAVEPNFSSILIIRGSLQNNGTLIYCNALANGITSDEKVLKLQVYGKEIAI